MGPARRALRDATHTVHDRLHGHPVLLPLTDPRLDLVRYRRALVALHGFHAPVERALAASGLDVAGGDGGRVALLRADLADLGVVAADLAEAGGLPDLRPPPAALAARYVLDGSAHGGLAMGPTVAAALGFDAAHGARFLGAGPGAGWPALLARLEAELAPPPALDTACAAAIGLFAALERWLDGFAPGG